MKSLIKLNICVNCVHICKPQDNGSESSVHSSCTMLSIRFAIGTALVQCPSESNTKGAQQVPLERQILHDCIVHVIAQSTTEHPLIKLTQD